MTEGIVMLVGGTALIVIGWLSRAEKLPRNHWAGIRLPSTLRTDAGWMAAQRVGAPFTITGGLLFIAWGIWLLIDVEEARDKIWFFLGPATVILIIGSFRGRAAAVEISRTDGQ
jgi:uncharacterized membrane protein